MATDVGRVVALGASNLTRGFRTVVSAARTAWGRDVEVLAALGHGRSYGAASSVLCRRLPGILESGLWRDLGSLPPVPTRAVVTDVGNDILYGFSAEQTLSWVEEAVSRLQRVTGDIILTNLPLASIRRLSPTRFLLFRSILVPSCRLSLAQVIDMAEQVDAGLATLSTVRGVTFFRLDPAWYGFDPVHIRPSLWRPAWRQILGAPSTADGGDGSPLEGLHLYFMRPERRWLFGVEQHTPQRGCHSGSWGPGVAVLKGSIDDEATCRWQPRLVVLSVKERAARCRLLGSARVITLQATRLWTVVPAEIVVVRPRKQWRYAGHPYLSGEIASSRREVAALGLVPLRLEDEGIWSPDGEYWGEEGQPIGEWAKPIIARGPRPMFEMEQILPGEDPDDPDIDPIIESNELKDTGDGPAAHAILMKLCEADLRCLDAHAHLGNFTFERRPEEAIRHYEAGVRIGELSLPPGFDGLLPWGLIDNRPFLRCMQGFGLCLWRLGRFEEAERVFARMLWLNPSDNQGVRFLVGDVRAGRRWEDRREPR